MNRRITVVVRTVISLWRLTFCPFDFSNRPSTLPTNPHESSENIKDGEGTGFSGDG